MSKPFAILLFIICLLVYYATIPSIVMAHWQNSPVFSHPILGPVAGWTMFLLPFILLGVWLYIRHKKKYA